MSYHILLSPGCSFQTRNWHYGVEELADLHDYLHAGKSERLFFFFWGQTGAWGLLEEKKALYFFSTFLGSAFLLSIPDYFCCFMKFHKNELKE